MILNWLWKIGFWHTNRWGEYNGVVYEKLWPVQFSIQQFLPKRSYYQLCLSADFCVISPKIIGIWFHKIRCDHNGFWSQLMGSWWAVGQGAVCFWFGLHADFKGFLILQCFQQLSQIFTNDCSFSFHVTICIHFFKHHIPHNKHS